MPKHSSEMPKSGGLESQPLANDNLERKHLRDAADLPPGESSEQAPEAHEEIRNKALRDMMSEIDEAPAGAVLFIGGVTSNEAWNESRTGVHRRASAEGYDEKFAHRLERDDVVFVSHQTMRGTTGGESNALAALKSAIVSNPGKTIVCDSNFPLTEHIFKPFQEEIADKFEAFSTGKQSKGSLEKWLADVQSEPPDPEAVSKVALLEELFASSAGPLLDFYRRYLGGREMVFTLAADNPLALAFFVYATKGNLQPATVRDVLGKFHGSKRAVEFVRIKDGKFITELQGRGFRPRSAA